jgi:peptidoglycan/xylan/chitin deacetylase (PgdA/CDA1 family)
VPAAHVPWFAGAFGLPRTLERSPGVALTFDDGPHPSGTPAVMERLAAAGAHATFFVVGEAVERRPWLVLELASAGHELAVHGYRHRLLLRQSAAALQADLERCLDLLEGLTGGRPRVYRPPHGLFSARGIAVVRRAGLQPLLWSRWGRDWERRATPAVVAARAGAGLRAGDVVLLHDSDRYSAPGSWRVTAAALPSILESGAAAGLPFVSVSQAM